MALRIADYAQTVNASYRSDFNQLLKSSSLSSLGTRCHPLRRSIVQLRKEFANNPTKACTIINVNLYNSRLPQLKNIDEIKCLLAKIIRLF